MKKPVALLSIACLSLALAACGSKEGSSSEAPKAAAGKDVPPPSGKAWTDMVSVTKDGGFLMGNPSAAIKVAEYGSFTCPHCRDFAAESNAEITRMVNSGRMSFEFRPYVRDPIDLTIALLASCNGAEPFFPLSHQLFENQAAMFQKVQAAGDKAYAGVMSQPIDQRFITLAQLTGLLDFVKQRSVSEEKAKQCLADQKAIAALAAHVQNANNSYQITGTPTLLINGSVVKDVASWDLMREKLKETGL